MIELLLDYLGESVESYGVGARNTSEPNFFWEHRHAGIGKSFTFHPYSTSASKKRRIAGEGEARLLPILSI